METAPFLVPLVILVPAIGAFINFFWGKAMGERAAGYVAVTASVITFILSLLIYGYLTANHGLGVVVDPFPFFDGWIRIGASEMPTVIPWQFRVDTLTGTMLLVVTGVGSLIHIYSVGYIHGDPKATRFFAYLNLFLMFMLILVTGNNFLMMFVGWEGVGLCSFLLIGYWWDKKGETGWQNGNAARKAMILNRVGDFGILMSVFLIFWTFGTLDYYRPGEVANPDYQLYAHGLADRPTEEHGEEGDHAEDESHSEETAVEEDHSAEATTTEEDDHSDEEAVVATDDHSDDSAYGDDGHGGGYDDHTYVASDFDNSKFTDYRTLGVFGQTTYLMKLPADAPEREVDFGAFTLDFEVALSLIILFMLLGAAGKSAQIPLFVWLPDAMAGPTPVSALMHAATMVTAGIYLLVRSSVFLDNAYEARFVIALIGTGTALVGGYMALGQWDIKRVLAYSTVSQLGFMIAAVGIGAYVAAMFHLVTHAVFKALLFLGSGSVIHGVEHGHHHVHEHHHDDHHELEEHATPADDHHEEEFDPQDMRNMGGLAGRMPATFVTYLAGTFALAGLPIFAGFWSKDEILAHAWDYAFGSTEALLSLGGFIVFGGLLTAAGFTAFYMWRQIQMVFFGEPRSEAAAHAPESNLWMTLPLVVLGILSTFVGLINIPGGAIPFSWFYELHAFGHFLEPSIPYVTKHPALDFNWLVAAIATGLAFAAIFVAHSIYAGDKAVVNRHGENTGDDPLFVNTSTRQVWRFANARMHWDAFYHAVFLNPYHRIGDFLANTIDWDFLHDFVHDRVIKRGYDAIGDILAKPVDIGLIDGVVNGVGKLVNLVSGRSKGIQTGYVRTYAVALLAGVVTVIVLMLLPLLLNGS